jgi:DNA-binding transcriptional LysR family regulator
MAVFVGESAGDMNGCRIHDYREDNFVLILPAGHRFAGMDSIWFAETLDEYFIGPESVTAWDDTISRAALDARRAVRYRMRLKSSFSLVNMVAAGLGISVMPYGMLAAISRDTGLQTVRLKDAWAKRMIKLAVREDDALSMPARLMVKHLLQRDHEQAV